MFCKAKERERVKQAWYLATSYSLTKIQGKKKMSTFHNKNEYLHNIRNQSMSFSPFERVDPWPPSGRPLVFRCSPWGNLINNHSMCVCTFHELDKMLWSSVCTLWWPYMDVKMVFFPIFFRYKKMFIKKIHWNNKKMIHLSKVIIINVPTY